MKINNTTPPVSPVSGGQGGSNSVKSSDSSKDSAAATPSTVDHLSRALSDTSGDINAQRVEEIRQAIIEGRLDIDTSKIADSLLNNLKGL